MCFFSMVQCYLGLSKEIEFVLDEIEKIVAESNGFSSGYKETTPGTLELRRFGAILHDFYNGSGISVNESPMKLTVASQKGRIGIGDCWKA